MTQPILPDYLLGHSDFELERLQLQSALIEGTTRRFIRESGIGPGMRVLDIGCGAGDVSMLLAEAVGPSGWVVAIDRERRAVDMAESRARAAGHRQIECLVTSDDRWRDELPFDAAIGRYVLVHQPEPWIMVGRAAAAVRPGGIVAFQEPALHVMGHAWPQVDLYKQTVDSMIALFRHQLKHFDVAGRMIACFEHAGLPRPHVTWESGVGGSDSPLIRWNAMTFRSLLPHIIRLDLPRPDIDAEALEERLRADIAAANAQIVSTPQSCAWAVRPG